MFANGSHLGEVANNSRPKANKQQLIFKLITMFKNTKPSRNLAKMLLCLVFLSLTSCEIFAVIDSEQFIIVESKISENRFRCRYNNGQNFLELITKDSLVVGDTLRFSK